MTVLRTARAAALELALLAGICFVCFLWQLGAAELHDFNEGMYVSAAREMTLRGDWAAPRYNGRYFFDKPPLALWCSAVCFRAFGISEAAARLPVAAATILLAALTFCLGARWFGRRAGLYAGCVFALSPLVLGTARQMTMDLHQSLWFAVAMASFHRAYTSPDARGKRWYWGMWAACGLGFMAKSVPGLFPLILCFAVAAIDARFQPRAIWRRVAEARVPGGIVILLAIATPWHVLAYRSAGMTFYQEYFLLHHVALLTGKDFGHARPVWYYLPSLAWGMFPWSLFLPVAMVQAWRGATPDRPGEDRDRRFALAWAIGLVVLFSAMTSKLHSYLLPMYAAAAILVGDWLARAAEARQGRALPVGAGIAAALAGLVAVAAGIAVARIAGTPREVELHETLSDLALRRGLVSVYALAAGFAVAWVLVLMRRRHAGIATMIGAMTLFAGMLVAWMLPGLNATINVPLHEVARVAGRHAADGIPLAVHIGGPVRPSVYYYMPPELARRPVPPSGEVLLSRSEKEPIDAFLAANRPAYVMTDTRRAAALMASHRGLRIEMQRSRWALIRAEPLPGGTPR